MSSFEDALKNAGEMSNQLPEHIKLPDIRTFVVKFFEDRPDELVEAHIVETSANYRGMGANFYLIVHSSAPQIQGPIANSLVRSFADVKEIAEIPNFRTSGTH